MNQKPQLDSGGSEKRRHHEGSERAPKRRSSSHTERGTLSRRCVCVRHSRPLDIYCCTDHTIICADCATADHMDHTIGSVSEERRRKQAVLKKMQTECTQILQKQEKLCENTRETLKQIPEQARETQNYCESVLVGIIDSLQRHYMSVRELITGQEKEAAARLEASLKTLQVQMEELWERDAELERLAQTDSDISFLRKWPSLQRLCENDHLRLLHEVPEDPLQPFETTKRAVVQLGKQLEEFSDKEFTSIYRSADSGEQQMSDGETEEEEDNQTAQSHGTDGVNNTVTEKKAGPQTRAEFLQYACDLSLDPSTAHVDLVISAGDKEVKLNPLRCKIPSIRDPNMFIHRRQVLCREGLQGERCYYEVEVEGDKSEIAVTYKGIDRKSRTRLSAFGGNAHSWSLDRSTNYSVSHQADSIQLSAHPSHHRLGVYLDFIEGTLSFFEVSESMTFLYKVEAKFKEPLYPGFWLGEKCCIRICDLRQDGPGLS